MKYTTCEQVGVMDVNNHVCCQDCVMFVSDIES